MNRVIRGKFLFLKNFLSSNSSYKFAKTLSLSQATVVSFFISDLVNLVVV